LHPPPTSFSNQHRLEVSWFKDFNFFQVLEKKRKIR
jgi:hypothetical protein